MGFATYFKNYKIHAQVTSVIPQLWNATANNTSTREGEMFCQNFNTYLFNMTVGVSPPFATYFL